MCSKHGSLLQFFSEVFTLLGALQNERRHTQLMVMSRISNNSLTDTVDMKTYRNLLTTYAFEELQKQAKLE